MNTAALFYEVDDCCRAFVPVWERWQLPTPQQHHRKSGLCLSEVMTIMIQFHASGYRTFKAYYTNHVLVQQRTDFPKLVSYNRFVELLPATLLPFTIYLRTRFGQCSGISFIDATSIAVCHNRRISSHRVLKNFAARGTGEYGLVLRTQSAFGGERLREVLNVKITAGNVADVRVAPDLVASLYGKVFGDKGYLSQPLLAQLYPKGIQLITKLRQGMKNK